MGGGEGGIQREKSLISIVFQTITRATQFADGSNKKGHGTTSSLIRWQRSTVICTWKYTIPTRQFYIWLVGLENTLLLWQSLDHLLLFYQCVCTTYGQNDRFPFEVCKEWFRSYPNIFVLYESSSINIPVGAGMRMIGWLEDGVSYIFTYLAFHSWI